MNEGLHGGTIVADCRVGLANDRQGFPLRISIDRDLADERGYARQLLQALLYGLHHLTGEEPRVHRCLEFIEGLPAAEQLSVEVTDGLRELAAILPIGKGLDGLGISLQDVELSDESGPGGGVEREGEVVIPEGRLLCLVQDSVDLGILG